MGLGSVTVQWLAAAGGFFTAYEFGRRGTLAPVAIPEETEEPVPATWAQSPWLLLVFGASGVMIVSALLVVFLTRRMRRSSTSPAVEQKAPARPPEERRASSDDITREAKIHFANLSVRGYDAIFGGDLIHDVLTVGSASSAAEGKSQRRGSLSVGRLFRAVGFALATTLNVSNIVVQFLRTIPMQRELAHRWRAGLVLSDYRICANAQGYHGDSCADSDTDQDTFVMSVLAWSELAMIVFVVGAAVKGLSKLVVVRADEGAKSNMVHWISIGRGFSWLEEVSSTSAIKILPRLKQLPVDAIKGYKLEVQKLTADDGVFSAMDRIVAASLLLFSVLYILVVGFAGLLALHLKMKSLDALNTLPIGRWNSRTWLSFFGFANQVSGLVPLPALKKQALLFFIFTGEDAELQAHEYHAMQEFNAMLYKTIFGAFGATKGFLMSLTVNSDDLQRIVLTEHAKK